MGCPIRQVGWPLGCLWYSTIQMRCPHHVGNAHVINGKPIWYLGSPWIYPWDVHCKPGLPITYLGSPCMYGWASQSLCGITTWCVRYTCYIWTTHATLAIPTCHGHDKHICTPNRLHDSQYTSIVHVTSMWYGWIMYCLPIPGSKYVVWFALCSNIHYANLFHKLTVCSFCIMESICKSIHTMSCQLPFGSAGVLYCVLKATCDYRA